MPGNRQECPGGTGVPCREIPHDKVKVGLPEAWSPEGGIWRLPERRLKTGTGPCGGIAISPLQSSGAQERCPVGAFKETDGTPKSC